MTPPLSAQRACRRSPGGAWLARCSPPRRSLMLLFRAELDKAHFALVYLLIVLGGSAGRRARARPRARGARLPALRLSVPPAVQHVHHRESARLVRPGHLPRDERRRGAAAHARAASAPRRRAAGRRRCERLAALGAETLNAGSAEESLAAIADVIQGTLAVERCEIYAQRDAPDGTLPGRGRGGAARRTATGRPRRRRA